jgi:hypothetical protein
MRREAVSPAEKKCSLKVVDRSGAISRLFELT